MTIALSQGGRFTLEVGDTDFTAIEAINATRDLLKAGEILFGVWGDRNDHRKATVPRTGPPVDPYLQRTQSAYINPDYVAFVYAEETA